MKLSIRNKSSFSPILALGVGDRILHLFMETQITLKLLHLGTYDYSLLLSSGLFKNCQIRTHPEFLLLPQLEAISISKK